MRLILRWNCSKKAMHMAPDMTLVVNGDDALSAYLAKDSGNKYVTFGIGKQCQQEKRKCKRDPGRSVLQMLRRKAELPFYHYSQLGDYECRTADLKDRSSILMLKT